MDKQTLRNVGYLQRQLISIQQEIFELPPGVKSDRLTAEAQKVRDEIDAIEEWFDTIPPEDIKCILRLQYIEGRTLDEIADEVYYSRTSIKDKLRKFWANMP